MWRSRKGPSAARPPRARLLALVPSRSILHLLLAAFFHDVSCAATTRSARFDGAGKRLGLGPVEPLSRVDDDNGKEDDPPVEREPFKNERRVLFPGYLFARYGRGKGNALRLSENASQATAARSSAAPYSQGHELPNYSMAIPQNQKNAYDELPPSNARSATLRKRHVLGDLEWNWYACFWENLGPTLLTCAGLFIAGILASAAGIGGGGLFVVILMICNDLSPHQAVPLSKAIIFGGSVRFILENFNCGGLVSWSSSGASSSAGASSTSCSGKFSTLLSLSSKVFSTAKTWARNLREDATILRSKHPARNGGMPGYGNQGWIEEEDCESPDEQNRANERTQGAGVSDALDEPPPSAKPDLSVLCAVVPPALAGTVFGVLFNVSFPPFLLVFCLAGLLTFMSARTFATGAKKWRESGGPPVGTVGISTIKGGVGDGGTTGRHKNQHHRPLMSPIADVTDEETDAMLAQLHSARTGTPSSTAGAGTVSEVVRDDDNEVMNSARSCDSTSVQAPAGASTSGGDDVRKNLKQQHYNDYDSEDDDVLRAVSLVAGAEDRLWKNGGPTSTTTAKTIQDYVLLTVLLAITVLAGYRSHLYPRGSLLFFVWILIPCLCAAMLSAFFYRAVLFGKMNRGRSTFGGSTSSIRPQHDTNGGFATPRSPLGRVILAADRKMPSWHYPAIGVFAGVCSGLFGVGGGLIFSPFFLFMGDVAPPVAVATSATCVIFTSTSTTVQYTLLHRIVMPYALLYALVSFFSASFGVKFLRIVRQECGPKGDAATVLVVAAAVLVSAVAVVVKLGMVARGGGGEGGGGAGGYWEQKGTLVDGGGGAVPSHGY